MSFLGQPLLPELVGVEEKEHQKLETRREEMKYGRRRKEEEEGEEERIRKKKKEDELELVFSYIY